MPTQTAKLDWFTTHLSQQPNVLVSDDDFLLKVSNIASNGEFSIRFIGNASIGYRLFLIIKNDDLDFLSNQTLALNNLIDFLNALLATDLIVIICKSSLSSDISLANFYIYEKVRSFFHYCNADRLATAFTNINSNYTENVGETKSINKTVNDDFQLFTRTKLSRFLTANDIDAIVLEQNQTTQLYRIERILELKRIDIQFNTVNTWKPYMKDYSNYNAVRYICNASGANDRTIVYYADNKNGTDIGVHTLTSIIKTNHLSLPSRSLVVPYLAATITNP